MHASATRSPSSPAFSGESFEHFKSGNLLMVSLHGLLHVPNVYSTNYSIRRNGTVIDIPAIKEFAENLRSALPESMKERVKIEDHPEDPKIAFFICAMHNGGENGFNDGISTTVSGIARKIEDKFFSLPQLRQ